METYIVSGVILCVLGALCWVVARWLEPGNPVGRVLIIVGFAFLLAGVMDLGPHAMLYASWPWPATTPTP